MNQLDYVISYFIQLYLMFHACVRKFDVIGIAQTFLGTKHTEHLQELLYLLVKYGDYNPFVKIKSYLILWGSPKD